MNSRFFFRAASLLATFALATSLAHAAENWPQFRGPAGDGHSDAKSLPVTFSETEHVKWKTAIHGKAWSSPVIWKNQVWLTTATEDGRELSVLCVDKTTGAVLRDTVLFRFTEPPSWHTFNSYGSPTPVIEEGRVYVNFGSQGTACLDTATGKVLWQRTDLACDHFRGAGSSPILHGDRLLLHFDGIDVQFVVALDKQTGRTVWKIDRSIDFQDLDAEGKPAMNGDLRKAFATPHIVILDGRPVLLSSGAKAHYAYDPATGAEIWRLEERAQHSASTRSIVAHGLAFFQTGFGRSQLLAVKLGGTGLLDATQIAWREKRNIPNKPSLLAVGDLLFMVDDTGVASCLEVRTGAEVWRERLPGGYSASPIFGAGRLYFFSEAGHVTVLEPGRTFTKLAENKFDAGFMASPAVSGSALFLRTRTHLYRVE